MYQTIQLKYMYFIVCKSSLIKNFPMVFLLLRYIQRNNLPTTAFKNVKIYNTL